MEDLDPNDFYRSSDMGVVTYLRVEGHTPQTMIWENDTCYWSFRITPALLSQLENYLADTSLVNPRDYNRRYAEVKREFYASKSAA